MAIEQLNQRILKIFADHAALNPSHPSLRALAVFEELRAQKNEKQYALNTVRVALYKLVEDHKLKHRPNETGGFVRNQYVLADAAVTPQPVRSGEAHGTAQANAAAEAR